MRNEPLVSVLIPVYNVEKYVKAAIESIQNQTYNNLEIIVIDDGSKDNTFEIVKELSKNDSRIRLYKNETNIKIVKTLNYALSLARGEYIARMDGDDISELDRIERKIDFLKENTDIDLVGCSLISIDSNGGVIKKIRKLQDFNLIRKTLRYTSPISHIWVCKKTVYDKLNGYRELSGAEDYDFILRLISTGMKAVNIADYYGYKVRIDREGNTVSSTGLLQKKLHEKIYQMYRQRISKGADEIDRVYPIVINKMFNKLYMYSCANFNEARLLYVERRFIKMLYKISLSLVSPHQIHAYYLRVSYKLKLKIYGYELS